MAHIDTLTRSGLRASVQPGGKLRLEPSWLITGDIRLFVREHRAKIVEEILATGNAGARQSTVEVTPNYHILYVATDLDSFEADDPRYGYEMDCEPVYRMLDASYYAWLRHRMENAKKARDAGRMDGSAFATLRTRFNAIHSWAMEHIGEDALRLAQRSTNLKTYVPPSQETYAAYRRTWDEAWQAFRGTGVAPQSSPTRGDRCPGASPGPPNGADSGATKDALPADAVAKVDRVRDQAMALGWTETGLYGNSGKHPFPYGDGYGIVRFVKKNCTIGEVTAEAIEIIRAHAKPDGTVAYSSLRRYNPDVRQPWRTTCRQSASTTDAKSAFPAQVGVAGSTGD